MVQTMRPAASVEVWAVDEHRIGLQPVTRKVWARRGQRPVASARRRYQWCYLYAFVRPHTGETYWFLLPTVNAATFAIALAAFAASRETNTEVILVLDNAGWHTRRTLQPLVGVHPVYLPPYSPALQPVERVWTLSNEPLVNRGFAHIEELEAVQAERCRQLQEQRERIRARTAYHWWPVA